MLQLQQKSRLLAENKIKVVVIVPENETKLKKYLSDKQLDFTFVPDPKHQIADKYQQEVKILKLGRMPAQIVLDKELNKIYGHFASSMSDIVEENQIIKEIKEVKSE